MKRKFLVFIVGTAIIGAAAFNFSLTSKNDTLSYLTLANIEALAKTEQPDIGDCIWVDEWVKCVALHPTDPKKDEETPWGWAWP